jgi:hypothetical protein
MSDLVDLTNQLFCLVKRIQDDKDFFASVIEAYKESTNFDDEALAKDLGLSKLDLARLALCRRPNSDKQIFADQVRQIAEYVGTEANKLATIVRHVEALESLKQLPESSAGKEIPPQQMKFVPGLITAARDKSDSDEED